MGENQEAAVWRKCSSCKKPIGYNARYYVCSVSTCNGQRTGYVFCSILCFERHLPGARHKDAAAIEMTSPGAAVAVPSRRIIAPVQAPAAGAPAAAEVLVIASRLKDYIQERSGFNTSTGVMDILSAHLRIVCDRAIDQARAEGRKTVMDRDFDFLKK